MKVCAILLFALVGTSVAVSSNGWFSKAGEWQQKLKDFVAAGTKRHQEAVAALQSRVINAGDKILDVYRGVAARGDADMKQFANNAVENAPEAFQNQVQEITDALVKNYEDVAERGLEDMTKANDQLDNGVNIASEKINALEKIVADAIVEGGDVVINDGETV